MRATSAATTTPPRGMPNTTASVPRQPSSAAASSRPAAGAVGEDGHAPHDTPAASAAAGNARGRRFRRVLCMCIERSPSMTAIDPTDLELGLDTFGDVTRDESGALRQRRADHPQRRRPGGARRRGRARRSSGWGSTTAPSSRSRAPRSCWRPRPPAPRSIHLGTAVTVLSSDDPVRVYERFATLDAVSQRPRRGHPRARLVHRVVPAVRLRPARLRGALRGEARAVLAAARPRSR